ncbi:MAG: CHAD domain-containing protein [Pseudomonadales bacterium]|nr:CHAD domain-containing protein [Pseudomonadales bacterium]
MMFQFDDEQGSAYQSRNVQRYFSVNQLPSVLEALGRVQALNESESDHYQLCVFDAFGGRLFTQNLTLLARVEGNRKQLLLLKNSDQQGNTVVAEEVWCKKAWPQYYWEFTNPNMKAMLKSALGYWSLISRQQFDVERQQYRVEDKRDKTVARLVTAKISCNDQQFAGAIPEYAEVKLTSLRGYENSFNKLASCLDTFKGDLVYPFNEQFLAQIVTREQLKSNPLHPTQTIYHALSRMFAEALEGLTLYHPGTIDDVDTEFLHQYRVSVRKTRSLIKEFKKVLPGDIKPFASFFKNLNNVTAPVRDLDVYLLKVEEWTEERGIEFRKQIGPFEQLLNRKRRSAFKKMLTHLQSDEYQLQLERWQNYLDKLSESKSEQDIQTFSAKLIAKCYGRLLKEGGCLTEASPDEEYHELRLTFKRFRYVLEFFNDLFASKQYKTLYKQAKRLQTLLGDFQDITVQKSALHDFADELAKLKSVNHETFLALGQVTGEFSNQHDDLKHRFHVQFTAFCDDQHKQMIANLGETVV